MINTGIFLENIKTDLSSATWTSPSTLGVSQFTDVFTFPNWVHVGGSPFLVILDDPQTTREETNSDAEFTSLIEFYICVNWSHIDATSEALQREESLLRMREAYDFLREYIVKEANIDTWKTTPNNAVRAGSADLIWRAEQMVVETRDIDDLNIYSRRIGIPVTDVISLI